MFWKKVFGEKIYEQVKSYAKERNFTISTLVRIAVSQYIKEN